MLNGQQDFKMRFKELLEYKRDITISNFGDRLISRMHNDTTLRDWITTRQPEDSQLHDMFFDEVEQADPSQNKQYVQWIVQRFLDKSIVRYEDISSSIAEFLFKYHELKTRNRLNDPSDGAQSIPNDINQIKTKDGINAVHTEMTPRWNRMNVELKDRQEQKVLSKGKSTEVYQDEQVRVIVPEDEDAACYYGQGTQWCTASTIGQNYFNHYNNNGKLYILIPKKPEHEGEKYQLHFNDNQHMDENDNPILLGQILDVRFAGSDLIDFLMANEPSITKMIEFTPEHVLMDVVDILVKFTTDNLIPPIIEKLSEKNHVAYYDWLDEGGFLFKDSNNNVKVKDDAPKYLEFDGESKDAIESLLFFVDMNYAEIMDVVDMDYDQDIHYSNDNVNYIISSKVQDAGWEEENQWIYDEVAEAIDNNITINMNYDDTNGSFKLNGFDVYAYEGNDQGYRLGGKDYT